MANLNTLSAEDKADFCSHIKTAMFHLASCWDALREAECLVGGGIETDDISGLTSEVTDPSEAYKTSDSDVLEALMEVVV
jgi:hypothetical protein